MSMAEVGCLGPLWLSLWMLELCTHVKSSISAELELGYWGAIHAEGELCTIQT
jgi:hypothetical protein